MSIEYPITEDFIKNWYKTTSPAEIAEAYLRQDCACGYDGDCDCTWDLGCILAQHVLDTQPVQQDW